MTHFLNSDMILHQATKHFNSLSPSKQDKVKESLCNGTAILHSNDQMKTYLHLYGEIHRCKLLRAFKHIPESVIRQKLSVIDWGCGQGLAPIVLNEFINDITKSYGSITDITLIEPSGCCLNQAYAFIEWSIPYVMISTIMKEEVDIQPKEICVQENTIIHLLSNIVDMPQFNGAGIRKYLKSASRCRNIIVIVSPFYKEEGRGKRMDIFVDTLKDFHKIYSFQKHRDDWKEDYSCQIRILDNCRD